MKTNRLFCIIALVFASFTFAYTQVSYKPRFWFEAGIGTGYLKNGFLNTFSLNYGANNLYFKVRLNHSSSLHRYTQHSDSRLSNGFLVGKGIEVNKWQLNLYGGIGYLASSDYDYTIYAKPKPVTYSDNTWGVILDLLFSPYNSQKDIYVFKNKKSITLPLEGSISYKIAHNFRLSTGLHLDITPGKSYSGLTFGLQFVFYDKENNVKIIRRL
jgi:hypothetical protein